LSILDIDPPPAGQGKKKPISKYNPPGFSFKNGSAYQANSKTACFEISLFVLVSVFPQLFLAFVGGDFPQFAFSSAGHFSVSLFSG
jgi:hypothetical protein